MTLQEAITILSNFVLNDASEKEHVLEAAMKIVVGAANRAPTDRHPDWAAFEVWLENNAGGVK